MDACSNTSKVASAIQFHDQGPKFTRLRHPEGKFENIEARNSVKLHKA